MTVEVMPDVQPASEKKVPPPLENKSTEVLDVTLAERMKLTLSLFDANGRRLAELWRGEGHTGQTSFPFDLSSYPAGRYYLHLDTPAFSRHVPLTLLK